ncbi:MAG: DUF2892 domain-containing protein [Thiobacillaceae bacterium]
MDCFARALLGLTLIGATLGWTVVLGWEGVVPLGTAVFRFCPLYALLGSIAAVSSQAIQDSWLTGVKWGFWGDGPSSIFYK